MKVLGVLGLAVVLFATTSSMAAEGGDVCKRYFSDDQAGSSKILADYKRAADILSRENFVPANDFESGELLSESKLNFVKKHQNSIQNLISKGEVSMLDIARAKVFLAEIVSNGLARPHSYLVMIGDQTYTFDLQGKTYKTLDDNKIGMTSKESMIQFLRTKEFVVFVDNNKAYFYNKESKDPRALGEMAKANQLPAHLQKLYATHKHELVEILTHTTVTIESLMQAPEMIATTPKGERVVMLAVSLLEGTTPVTKTFYFTSKGGIVENTNMKRWGDLSFSSHMGYDINAKVKLTTEDGTVFVVEEGAIKFSKEAKMKNSLLTFAAVVSDSNTSKFRANFIKKHGEAVQELIKNDMFKEENFNDIISQLDVAVNSRNEKFYILPFKDGDLYFAIDSAEQGKLANIALAEHGKNFYAGNGEMIQVGRGFGFLAESVTKRLESDSVKLSIEAFLTKIEVALENVQLTRKHADSLVDVREKVLKTENKIGPIRELPSEKYLEIATEVKVDLINEGGFTKREAEEIIKVLF